METMNEISGYLSPISDSGKPNSQEMDIDEESSEEEPIVTSATTRQKMTASAAKAAQSIPPVQKYAFIPLRLTADERRLLNVLENALEVCEYTDVVDVTFSHTRKSKVSRIFESLVDILSISCGLLMSNNLSKGEQLMSGKSLNDNIPLFKDLFEIARRYKIMNPSKMRGTYGKLMYVLMDTESHVIKSELKVSFVKPIQTVKSCLEDKGLFHILNDPLWAAATVSVSSNEDGEEKSKTELAKLQKEKSLAAEALLQKYTSEKLTSEEIQRLIESIGDNEAYLDFNVKPVRRILKILNDSFDPKKPVDPFSLHLQLKQKKLFSSFSSMYSGYSSGFLGGGAALSHDHATQFRFVLQSFTLWKEIMQHMPKLWLMADYDLCREEYRLVDTGQGYQRLQGCPHVRQEMSRILHSVQSCCGPWAGLSVVHLGDRDVPNALIFIDKYTQVPRILAPIVNCIEHLPTIAEDSAFHRYLSAEWGSIDGVRMQILSDFFKHGFDGSGDDGGSCIDGRLTSAWNWCSKLHKKPYYYVFMFAGFQGFDGDWKEN